MIPLVFVIDNNQALHPSKIIELNKLLNRSEKIAKQENIHSIKTKQMPLRAERTLIYVHVFALHVLFMQSSSEPHTSSPKPHAKINNRL